MKRFDDIVYFANQLRDEYDEQLIEIEELKEKIKELKEKIKEFEKYLCDVGWTDISITEIREKFEKILEVK